MNTYDDKYHCTLETLKETLDEYGVAVLPALLTEEECITGLSDMWDFIEHISQSWEVPLNRNDNTTWKGYYKLLPMHSMLLQHYGIGHSEAVWKLRQHPKLIAPFETLWGENAENLLVSFDGASFSMPPEITGRGWFRKNWFHTDQSYTRNDFECVQSWVTLLDVEKGDATLAFYEKSHKLHKEFSEKFGIKDKSDWFQLKGEQESFYSSKCEEKRIMCPKGSMVFWDSRLIHCGNEPIKTRKTEKNRCVVYLCYQPRRMASESQIKKKKKAFNDLRMTSHWPCKVTLFGKKPQTWGNELPPLQPIDVPVLSELGKKLAGF